MRRIADQHDVLVVPLATEHARELDPHRRAAQVARIGDQLVAIEHLREAVESGDNEVLDDLGWTRDQARAYLLSHTALSEREVNTEVDRYISWPGQALAYYLGQMAIEKGRAKAEAALGSRFNIRAFHDTVLSLGSVPLPVLTDRIDQFIAEGGVGPYPDAE
jgi:DNA-directed RNA polymerase subunit N (RpoN/RPB10)